MKPRGKPKSYVKRQRLSYRINQYVPMPRGQNIWQYTKHYLLLKRLLMKQVVPRPFVMGVRTFVSQRQDLVRTHAYEDYVQDNWTNFIAFQQMTTKPKQAFYILSVMMIDEDDHEWTRILRTSKTVMLEIYNPELSV